MRQILGANLSARLQAEALARFVHRSTGEHNGNNGYPIQFANDADWLAHTLFWVTQGGKLSTRARYCQSSPTWPNNPELRTR